MAATKEFQKRLPLAGTAKLDVHQRLVVRATPKVPLTHREFAERHVRLATGPYRGQPFLVRRQPFVGLLFDELDHGDWQTVYITGPSQSSKTLSGFVIPTLRDACELQEDVILGCPEADMADDKWQRDFVPILRSSPDLQWLLPETGPGSRGGTVKDRITLGNGVMLKIMTCGGQDTSVAGYTSPRVRLTEAAGWSRNKDGSVEADRVRQISARMRAFKRHRRSITVEGTVTIRQELPWRARGDDNSEAAVISTRSRIVCPCPHCGAWISPEREHLVGWQDAENEQQAAELAAFFCPECGESITDQERRSALADCRLVHHGQRINNRGEVVGAIPPTSTLWFRWSAWHNLLLDASDTAVDEWKAAQVEDGTMDRINAERELCQFCWAIPHEPSEFDAIPLDAGEVSRRRGEKLPRGIIPADTEFLSAGVDIGKDKLHWVLIAWRPEVRGHVADYGVVKVKHYEMPLELAIIEALERLNEVKIAPGWPTDDGKRISPGWVFVDSNYQTDPVYQFVVKANKEAKRFLPSTGYGSSQQPAFRKYPMVDKITDNVPFIGEAYHIRYSPKRHQYAARIDADYWKTWVHQRLKADPPGSPGSIVFFEALAGEHREIARHLTSEREREEVVPGKGMIVRWFNETGRANHFLDATYLASTAGHLCGARLVGEKKAPRQSEPNKQRQPLVTTPDGRPFLVTERL